MDQRDAIREFLTTRRAAITPQEAGLPVFGGARRVPGLRREEVAMLAGVSVDYYTRMERGNLAGVSESVLEALCAGLRLDDVERQHLFDLARAASPGSGRRQQRRRARPSVRPSVERLLDAMAGAPAFVQTARGDVLAANPLGRALYAPMFDAAGDDTPNHSRFIFLSPASREFYVDWDRIADDSVAILRTEAGRDPYDRDLSDLVGELSTRSDDFRTRWAKHNVHIHRTGLKRFRHPVVGELHLTFEILGLAADQDLTILTYTTEAGSRSEEALRLLGSWSAEPATGR
jgi:transcriptional regulator with XRE-family HTH domain